MPRRWLGHFTIWPAFVGQLGIDRLGHLLVCPLTAYSAGMK
jgi:hypothetical protein